MAQARTGHAVSVVKAADVEQFFDVFLNLVHSIPTIVSLQLIVLGCAK